VDREELIVELGHLLPQARALLEFNPIRDSGIVQAKGEALARKLTELLPALGYELRARGDEVFTVPGAGAPYSRKLWQLGDALLDYDNPENPKGPDR
jgi:hypothetical protein